MHLGLRYPLLHEKKLNNPYFKWVYQLSETPATRALSRLDLLLKVPSEALESSKEIKIIFFHHPTGNRMWVFCAAVKHANRLANLSLQIYFKISLNACSLVCQLDTELNYRSPCHQFTSPAEFDTKPYKLDLYTEVFPQFE